MAEVKQETAGQAQETVDESKQHALDRLTSLVRVVNADVPDKVELADADVGDLSKGARVTASVKVLVDLLREREEGAPAHVDEGLLNELILQLDDQIGKQLDAVLHHPEFKRLESAWRGLDFLVKRTDFNEPVQVKLLNVSKKELHASFEKVKSPYKSELFWHVYKQRYDTPGGKPVGALISNYEFDDSNRDNQLLRNVSKVAARAHSPFIGAVSPAFFGKNNFEDWKKIPDLEKHMASLDFTKWNSFRRTEDARYVGLVFPRFLLRTPYGPDDVEGFEYKEGVTGKDHEKYLWGNASYAFAANLTDAFAKYGWAVQIRGPEAGGAVKNLELHRYGTGKAKIPVEVDMDMARQLESANQGLIPLSVYKDEDFAVFFSADSAQRPKEYSTPGATTNARLSASLPYIFLASHLAHYMKVKLREEIGKMKTTKIIKEELDNWLKDYINRTPGDVPEENRAKRPLRDAKVTVEDIPGKPGYYRVAMKIVPHFQLEGVDVTLNLTGELASEKDQG